jgi:hypothetical protein
LRLNIEILRRKIAAGHYQLTQHAKDEAADEEIDIDDIESIVLGGNLVKTLTKDRRGPRYIVAGLTIDKRSGRVVCRTLPSGKLRIITVYLER